MVSCAHWNEAVKSHSRGTPFHLIEWLELSSFYNNEVISLERESSQVPLVEIRSRIFGSRLIATPYGQHGGPLTVSEDGLANLLHLVCDEGSKRRMQWIEMRDIDLESRKIFHHAGYVTQSPHITIELFLQQPENNLLRSMKKNTRSEIHKLEREKNLAFIEMDAIQGLREFYFLYTDTMRRHGSPGHSYDFFKKMWELFYPQGIVKIFFAKKNNEAIGAYLVFCFQGKIYHWSSVVNARYRKLDPQTFLMWELIQWGRTRGYQMIDFGRVKYGTPIHFYKSSWGGTERPLWDAFYFYGKEHRPPDPNSMFYRFARSIWKALPELLTKSQGPRFAAKIGL
jgi:hypothetical protein